MTDSHDDETPYSAIDAKLKSIAEAAPTKPAWYETWTKLGLEPTGEKRLPLCKSLTSVRIRTVCIARDLQKMGCC